MSYETVSVDLKVMTDADLIIEEKDPVTLPGSYGSLSMPELSLTRDQVFRPQTVIPEGDGQDDDRIAVQDTTAFPFRAICALELYFPDSPNPLRGTGTFIGPNMLLTCAHNLYKKHPESQVTSVVAYPGRSGHLTPFQKASAVRMFYPKAFQENEHADYDFAVLELDKAVGDQVGYCGLRVSGDGDLMHHAIHVLGYPVDRGVGAAWTLYRDHSRHNHLTPTQIYHRADTGGGTSGGPAVIFPDNDINAIPEIVGIHIDGDSDLTPGITNGARRIDQAVFDIIRSWTGR